MQVFTFCNISITSMHVLNTCIDGTNYGDDILLCHWCHLLQVTKLKRNTETEDVFILLPIHIKLGQQHTFKLCCQLQFLLRTQAILASGNYSNSILSLLLISSTFIALIYHSTNRCIHACSKVDFSNLSPLLSSISL